MKRVPNRIKSINTCIEVNSFFLIHSIQGKSFKKAGACHMKNTSFLNILLYNQFVLETEKCFRLLQISYTWRSMKLRVWKSSCFSGSSNWLCDFGKRTIADWRAMRNEKEHVPNILIKTKKMGSVKLLSQFGPFF